MNATEIGRLHWQCRDRVVNAGGRKGNEYVWARLPGTTCVSAVAVKALRPARHGAQSSRQSLPGVAAIVVILGTTGRPNAGGFTLPAGRIGVANAFGPIAAALVASTGRPSTRRAWIFHSPHQSSSRTVGQMPSIM
jgi:hypothetical protein